jgi:type II secretory pathway component GspD/PulD (secretin)
MLPAPVGLLAAALLLAFAQDPPPKPPEKPPDPPKTVEGGKIQDRGGGDILYQVGKFKRPDGLVSLCYKVGNQRGRLLKAILEGQTLHIPGQPAPMVSVTPGVASRILGPKGFALESEDAHLLIVTDVEENVAYLEAVLKMLDVPEPQVLIEARIVELRWDSDLQFGIEGEGATSTIYTLPTGSEAFLREIRAKFNPTEAITGGPFQGSTFRFGRTSSHQGTLGGILQAFVQRGQAEILSSPRILASNGREALILAGERVPYSEQILQGGVTSTTIKYEDANLQLKVRPHIVGSSHIQLEIDTSIKSLTGFVSISGLTAATFSNRQAKTEVTVLSGEEIWLGGLVQKEKSKIRRGLPILSDIPIFGPLFGRYEESESVREIVFTLRPVIMEREKLPSIIDPGRR